MEICLEGHIVWELEVIGKAHGFDGIDMMDDDFGAGGGDWGAMGWHAPAVAQALEVASGNSPPEARRAAIGLVTEALHTELPVIPIAWYQHTAAHAVGLEGVVIDPLATGSDLSIHVWMDRN